MFPVDLPLLPSKRPVAFAAGTAWWPAALPPWPSSRPQRRWCCCGTCIKCSCSSCRRCFQKMWSLGICWWFWCGWWNLMDIFFFRWVRQIFFCGVVGFWRWACWWNCVGVYCVVDGFVLGVWWFSVDLGIIFVVFKVFWIYRGVKMIESLKIAEIIQRFSREMEGKCDPSDKNKGITSQVVGARCIIRRGTWWESGGVGWGGVGWGGVCINVLTTPSLILRWHDMSKLRWGGVGWGCINVLTFSCFYYVDLCLHTVGILTSNRFSNRWKCRGLL